MSEEPESAAGRRVDFLHFPTLGSADDAFFAPLAELTTGAARVYVGALHHMHDRDGLRRQTATIHKYLKNFGLAAPCGFGRTPERPGRMLTETGAEAPADLLNIIVRDHLQAVPLLHEA